MIEIHLYIWLMFLSKLYIFLFSYVYVQPSIPLVIKLMAQLDWKSTSV